MNINLIKKISSGKRHFTLLEILIVISIMALLATMITPSYVNARAKARFVRWFAFNKQLCDDPNLVVNFNFQEGAGNTLNNTCHGCDVANYDAAQYSGTLMSSINGTKHNFEWVASGGRWGHYKKALQFNGTDTYIVMPGTAGLDFMPTDDFTILAWVKFDRFNLGDCIFSKSRWGDESAASGSQYVSAAQYDLYCDPTAGTTGKGSFEIDVFTSCKGYDETDINLKTSGWVMITLRYRGQTPDTANSTTWTAECFVNDQRLKKYRATNNAQAKLSHCDQKCILGAAGTNPYVWGSEIKFFFQGKMDEFLLWKRALSDGEIKGIYAMGRDK